MNDTMKMTGSLKCSENIRVFVRIRPYHEKEEHLQSCIASTTDKSISIKERDGKESHSFTFDGIFQSQASQLQVYEAVCGQIVNSAFTGINGTIFCYGQTSSGKTYTCIGPDYQDDQKSGIVPRLIKQTLNRMEQYPKNIECKMKISMVQIYNQKIKDLLDPSKTDLKIRSNKKEGIFLESMTQKYVLSQDIAFQYLSMGLQNRSVGVTNMNVESSRSHMVVIFNLSTHDIYTGQAKSAKLILVDLAGSQKISKTGAQGKILQQAKKINASLTALGKVIYALSDCKSTHVPYRDSKLTRFLQESLGGNSLTKLIVNISPNIFNDCQTLTSIRFGQRAKSIKNEPIVNKFYTADQLLILLKKAQQTIQRQNLLIKQLSSKRRTGGYGALNVPPVGTLHLIPYDDDQTQKSLQSENEDEELSTSSKIKLDPMKSQYSIKDKSQKRQSQQYDQKSQKLQTFTTFPVFNYLQRDETPNKQQKSSKSADKFTNIRNQESNNFNSLKVKHENQIKENFTNKLHDICKNQKKYIEDDGNIEENLNKIRVNLLELKNLYFQQKRQNSIQRMIIQRKNHIIEKSKSRKNIQFLR